MAFAELQALGEEKFKKILNALMRGERCTRLARTIQQQPPEGWGDFQHMSEGTLTSQLNRLRQVAATGIFGAQEAKKLSLQGKPNITRLEHITVPVLARIEELSEKERTLVMALLEKATEEKRTFTSVNDAVNNYRQTLLDIQKMRFEMGLDEFKGPVGSTSTIRGTKEITTFPDGMSVQKQVFEAVNVIERIFEQRKIPQVTEQDD